jgi:hypothetical protein
MEEKRRLEIFETNGVFAVKPAAKNARITLGNTRFRALAIFDENSNDHERGA